jgi:hypothetical protein
MDIKKATESCDTVASVESFANAGSFRDAFCGDEEGPFRFS